MNAVLKPTIITVATLAASFAANDKQARDTFIMEGNDFASAQNGFFTAAVALYIVQGDEPARELTRTTWTDSKDKRREYALKIFRMCKEAITHAGVDAVRAVSGFAALNVICVDAKKAKLSTPAANDAAIVQPGNTVAEQDERAENARGAVSRAADIANTIASIRKLASSLSFASEHGTNAKTIKTDIAAIAADLNVQMASLEALFA